MFKVRVRAIVGLMIFLGYFLIYIVRYNLSVHIVDMAKIQNRYNGKNSNLNHSQIVGVLKIVRLGGLMQKVYWNDIKVAQLFSAYYIGYCICFPIFHNLGDRLGPTWVVGIAGFISGVSNCLTPMAVYFHFYSIFAVRILIGFCAGAMQPSMVQLLRHWVPPIERNHFMWAYCGITIGTCSTFLLCAAVQYYFRWTVGFYISGTCQIIWSVCWVLVVTDYPEHHSCISDEEKTYLSNAIGNIFTIKLTNLEAPWKSILSSGPFWALCILNFGYAWMIIAMCLHGPIYYSGIAEYTLYNASMLTALPFFLRLVLGTLIIQIFHWYKHTTKVKRIKFIRKYFIVISHVIPGLVICFSWFTDFVPGPVLLTVAIAFTAAGMDLTLDLCYEITPTYVNSVNTIIKIVGNTPGIIISFCVGAVTGRFKNSPYVWKHIWCFHALVLFLSGVIFLIWGETDVQPWNSLKRRLRRNEYRARPKQSVMSNIIEVDEDDQSARTSIQLKKPTNLRSFKLSQISV